MVDDVSAKLAWEALLAEPDAQLVDVRTPAEWQHVGVPDLAHAGKQPVLVSWQFPTGAINPAFLDGLREAGLAPGQTLYFICRSGVRSLAAAEWAEAAGYARCFNVASGFEGHPDDRGRRGVVDGWQSDGLPWTTPSA